MTQDSTETTAPQAQHTPLPWLLDGLNHWYGPDGKTVIGMAYGEWQATDFTGRTSFGSTTPGAANALFVARAVNSFDEVLEYSRRALILCTDAAESPDCPMEVLGAIKALQAAIALAEGDPPRWTPAAVAAAAQEGGA